jgi:hypothetical protein
MSTRGWSRRRGDVFGGRSGVHGDGDRSEEASTAKQEWKGAADRLLNDGVGGQAVGEDIRRCKGARRLPERWPL